MRRAWFVAAVAFWGLACRKPAAPEPPVEPPITEVPAEPPEPEPEPELSPELKKLTWTVHSLDGRATVSQTAQAPGKCVVVSSGGSATWQTATCLGDAMRLRFVSPDGARLLEFDTLPAAEAGNAWAYAPVISLFERGVLKKQLYAGSLVHDPRRLIRFERHFAWLKGTASIEGEPPAYARDGRMVDAVTVDGEALHVAFEDAPSPAPVASAPAPTRPTLIPPPKLDVRRAGLPDGCERGRARVQAAERALASREAQQVAGCPVGNNSPHGDAEYASCMASGAVGRQLAARDAAIAAARRELEAAQDELRRAQVGGCD